MRRFALVVATVFLAGCANGDHEDALTLPDTEANVTGTFTLAYANGRPVPFDAIVTTGEVWTLVADRMILLPNNTWVDSTNYAVTNRTNGTTSTQATASAGTWAIADKQINFTMTAGGNVSFVGTVVVNNLAVNFNGQRYVYTR